MHDYSVSVYSIIPWYIMIIIFAVHLTCIHTLSFTHADLFSQCMIITFRVSQLFSHTLTYTKKQTDRQTDLSSQFMIIIFPVHLSCIHIPSKTDRQTDLSSQSMIIIFPVHLSCIHIPLKTDRQTDRQTYLHNVW